MSVARVGKFLRNEDLSDDNVHRNPHACKYTGPCVERDLSDKVTMPASELLLFGASDSRLYEICDPSLNPVRSREQNCEAVFSESKMLC